MEISTGKLVWGICFVIGFVSFTEYMTYESNTEDSTLSNVGIVRFLDGDGNSAVRHDDKQISGNEVGIPGAVMDNTYQTKKEVDVHFSHLLTMPYAHCLIIQWQIASHY